MSFYKNRTIISKYFIMFFLVGSLAFLIELFLFYILKEFFSLIFANVCARALSLFFHFVLLRGFVFNNRKRTLSSFFYYVILSISNSLITGIFIHLSSKIFIDIEILLCKIFFDLVLVVINYLIIRKYIFY